jgi:hypothetical protein
VLSALHKHEHKTHDLFIASVLKHPANPLKNKHLRQSLFPSFSPEAIKLLIDPTLTTLLKICHFIFRDKLNGLASDTRGAEISRSRRGGRVVSEGRRL